MKYKNIIIRKEESIKRLTIEWNNEDTETGYEDANAMITKKYGDVNIRTVRLGPKARGNMRVSGTIRQWIVDIYI